MTYYQIAALCTLALRTRNADADIVEQALCGSQDDTRATVKIRQIKTMWRGKSMNCFHCGRRIELNERISFRAVCAECNYSLHVCCNCQFYDSAFHNQCREPQAERVVDKERANFCEYFSPRQVEEPRRLAPANSARAKLDALFKKKL